MKLIQETVKIEYDGKFYYRKHFAPEKLTVWSSDTGRQLPDEVVLELEKEYSKYCTGFDISNNDQANGGSLGEGNPVGQVDKVAELFYNIINKGIITEKDQVLHISAQTLADILYSYKPRTTDKEHPQPYRGTRIINKDGTTRLSLLELKEER